MPARRIKSLKKEKGARAHREHRSKKGRRQLGERWQRTLNYKKRLEELKIKELEDESKIF